MTDDLHRRVLEIYAAVDAAVAAAGPKCDASGRCCRFKEWGHVLYLSALEAEVLLAGAPPYEKPVSPDFCPFQKENLCTAREPRPLGCRIYFCDPTYQETGNAIMENAVQRMKQLTTDLGRDWRYAPLHVFLNESSLPSPPLPERGDGGEGAERLTIGRLSPPSPQPSPPEAGGEGEKGAVEKRVSLPVCLG